MCLCLNKKVLNIITFLISKQYCSLLIEIFLTSATVDSGVSLPHAECSLTFCTGKASMCRGNSVAQVDHIPNHILHAQQPLALSHQPSTFGWWSANCRRLLLCLSLTRFLIAVNACSGVIKHVGSVIFPGSDWRQASASASVHLCVLCVLRLVCGWLKSVKKLLTSIYASQSQHVCMCACVWEWLMCSYLRL